jgi:hypothetical protein
VGVWVGEAEGCVSECVCTNSKKACVILKKCLCEGVMHTLTCLDPTLCLTCSRYSTRRP